MTILLVITWAGSIIAAYIWGMNDAKSIFFDKMSKIRKSVWTTALRSNAPFGFDDECSDDTLLRMSGYYGEYPE